MQLSHYRTLRTAVQDNAWPADGLTRRAVRERLRESLLAVGFLEDVEVEATENPDALVIAMCAFPADRESAEVARVLEQQWEERLSFPFWQAHAVLVDEDQVELQGATRAQHNGAFVTVHVVAQQVRFPAQRLSVPDPEPATARPRRPSAP